MRAILVDIDNRLTALQIRVIGMLGGPTAVRAWGRRLRAKAERLEAESRADLLKAEELLNKSRRDRPTE